MEPDEFTLVTRKKKGAGAARVASNAEDKGGKAGPAVNAFTDVYKLKAEEAAESSEKKLSRKDRRAQKKAADAAGEAGEGPAGLRPLHLALERHREVLRDSLAWLTLQACLEDLFGACKCGSGCSAGPAAPWRAVCLGLGSLKFGHNPSIQLALWQMLVGKLKELRAEGGATVEAPAGGRAAEVGDSSSSAAAAAGTLEDCMGVLQEMYDPIFDEEDVALLQALGCTVLSEQQGRDLAVRDTPAAEPEVEAPAAGAGAGTASACSAEGDSKPLTGRPHCLRACPRTLFFMPHCNLEVYDRLLEQNWAGDRLQRLVMIGNSLSFYAEVRGGGSKGGAEQAAAEGKKKKEKTEAAGAAAANAGSLRAATVPTLRSSDGKSVADLRDSFVLTVGSTCTAGCSFGPLPASMAHAPCKGYSCPSRVASSDSPASLLRMHETALSIKGLDELYARALDNTSVHSFSLVGNGLAEA